MKHGLPDIVHCPHCDSELLQPTLMSGNARGIRYWTDFKYYACMLPQIPNLVRCPTCKDILMVSHARKSESMKRRNPEAPWRIEPDRETWIEGVRRRLWRNLKEEIYLRSGTWHSANDVWRPTGRNDSTVPVQWTPDDLANMECIGRSTANRASRKHTTPTSRTLQGTQPL